MYSSPGSARRKSYCRFGAPRCGAGTPEWRNHRLAARHRGDEAQQRLREAEDLEGGAEFLAAGQKLLDEAALRLRQEKPWWLRLLLESNGERVSVLIAQQALTTQCQLVVLAYPRTPGRVDRLLMGSDAEQLARIAPVPVMLVRQSQSVIVTATPGQGGTPA